MTPLPIFSDNFDLLALGSYCTLVSGFQQKMVPKQESSTLVRLICMTIHCWIEFSNKFIINLKIQARPRNLSYATNPLERDKLMPSWSSDVSWDTRITNWNFEWPPRGIGLRGVALYHSIITPFRCVTFTRGPKYSLHRAGQSRGRAKMMRKTYVAFWALHINAWLFLLLWPRARCTLKVEFN